jgi:hypothetical protein
MIGNNAPNIVDSYTIRGVNYKSINFDIKEVEEGFEWESVEMPQTKWNYSGVVDALVQHKYPIDKMQAVINNYLLDSEDAYAIDEFNKMQTWRKEAKEIAKEALLYELSSS